MAGSAETRCPINNITVFIVDDSLIIRERLVEMLDEVGGAELVGQAATVVEAIQGIWELKPDVVVLDYRMPPEGSSGLDVLQAVKQDTTAAPLVIVLTQYPYPAYREKCLELGADYFFDKASEFDKVPEVIGQLARG
jgi:two-component system chemotaxis response regulator CheY